MLGNIFHNVTSIDGPHIAMLENVRHNAMLRDVQHVVMLVKYYDIVREGNFHHINTLINVNLSQ
jgi:hypothetical protein